MNTFLPLRVIIVLSLCFGTCFLNLIFLIVVYFENKRDKTLSNGRKDLLYFIIFSFGVFIYSFGQFVINISVNFQLNLFFHKVQHVGLAVSAIAYIFIPHLTFGFKNHNRKFNRVLAGVIIVMIPFIFTSWFIKAEPQQLTEYLLQGTENFLYVAFLPVFAFSILYHFTMTLFFAIKKKKKRIKLNIREKFLIATGGILTVSIVLEIILIFGVIPPVITDYFGLPVALTAFNILVSTLIIKELSVTMEKLRVQQKAVVEKTQKLEQDYKEILSTISEIQERDDEYTAGHSRRVMRISHELGKALKLNPQQINDLITTALMHDVGKVGVSKLVLNKPGRLSVDEFEEVKQHAVLGYDIVSSYKPFASIANYIRYHHEKLNGSGYPDGIAEAQMPYLSKILAIADIYDALHSKRPYRGALHNAKCLKIMNCMADDNEIDKKILKKLEGVIASDDKFME